jgi:hypothetical protein
MRQQMMSSEGFAMRNHWMVRLLFAAVAAILVTALAPDVEAQGRDPHARRPNAPPIPRLADGTPNLGSTTPNKGYWDLHQHRDYEEILLEPKEGIPYQPWAKALRDYRQDVLLSKDDPQGFCMPPGGARMMTTPFPMEFIQQPEMKRIIMIYEGGGHIWRVIYMDGRPHPPDVMEFPTWTGHSVGRWEGDTLVIDSVGYNEGHWVEMGGSPRTNLHHVVERFTRLDYYTLQYEATIDDPGAYTRPWTIRHNIQFDPEGEIKEYICQENNRFLERFDDLKMQGER